jgi:hypothetical protein
MAATVCSNDIFLVVMNAPMHFSGFPGGRPGRPLRPDAQRPGRHRSAKPVARVAQNELTGFGGRCGLAEPIALDLVAAARGQ